MAQPTTEQIFGSGATIDSNNLTIPLSALSDEGLNPATADAISCLGAIVKKSSAWLISNTDEAVMASASYSPFAPVLRNGVNKTQHSFGINFFGSYSELTFDPDDV